MYISTISLAEYFSVDEELPEEFSKAVHCIKFQFEEAAISGELRRRMRGPSTNGLPGFRDALKDDYKILACAARNGITHLITEDEKSMAQFARNAKEIMPELLGRLSVATPDMWDNIFPSQGTFDL